MPIPIRRQARTAMMTAVVALPSMAAAQAAPQAATNASAVDAIALYSQGAAVVQNSRQMHLAKGAQTVDWPIVGALRPDTLWLSGQGVRLNGYSAAAGGGQGGNSEADPLAARVGHAITLSRPGADGRPVTQQATLVAVHGETVYVRHGDRIERITANSPWQIGWPAGDGGHDDKRIGGLRLDVTARSAGRTTLTATYQVDGPSWQASYTGAFDPDRGTLALQSRAVIDNSGGTRLAADKAWLVAGDIARANSAPRPVMFARAEAKSAMASAPQAAGETYRYALDQGLDVPAGEVRAVALMPTRTFKAKKTYRIEGSAYQGGDERPSHAGVRLAFANDSGQPLPAGTIRVYDAGRAADLMGESAIGDTPAGAPVTLDLGQSFDVTSQRAVVSSDLSEGRHHREIKITVHNAGTHPAPVTVTESLPNAARIDDADPAQSDAGDAATARWQVTVPAHGQQKIDYTVSWPK